MADLPSPDSSQQNKNSAGETPPTPLRCFTGAIIAGGLAFLLYLLNQAIIQGLAAKPLPTSSVTATNIAVAVRTLVIGLSTLATAIFAIAALGLIALGIQLLIQQLRQPSLSNKE
ncbi:DUF3082 domain-containing protein [Oculatella sp. FACHB-28]|uniref:DUF3082 domain-containing protein n=1 Tax=Cyanophyceae TaxID=3028117 RepID=UPI00168433C3|nr:MULTISPECIES: DUF3082 domain-containing protein [Cyanophyceae]MBD1870821.1 DUF3082 domain-containing protein [Cyanobacteria bacterium FACHB-471]MBD1998330.1 DUF3082 domain-containing protein [Leptolyngbya sp. FACHB-541]MBD2056501.1 DUF3082 domain-containing protein [Oculatella sp. FACHB-28]MBD2069074.1 DUF3082 domain-containing protein [Leptolyngbya sp. FACHB-671]